ncbi:MAG: AtpZ/AtpI family protein [Bryobacterales bacterium]
MNDRENDQEKRDLPPLIRGLGGRAADAGWTLSGAIIGCLFVGYIAGVYFDANPAATVAGLIVGLIVGFYNLAKVMGLFG